jgi:hypothetical protein
VVQNFKFLSVLVRADNTKHPYHSDFQVPTTLTIPTIKAMRESKATNPLWKRLFVRL